jgi:hypothetical protein
VLKAIATTMPLGSDREHRVSARAEAAWRKTLAFVLVMSGATAVSFTQARAAETATICDELAGNPHDPNRLAPGVSFFEIDVAKAIPACETALAETPNDPRTMYEYGLALFRAHRNVDGSIWLRKAAEAGYAAAEADLGYAIDAGLAGNRDEVEALRWSQRSADHGYAVAMGDVGWHYMNGLGVERDLNRALEWFQRAIALGDEYSMAHLGQMYEAGMGVPQDDKTAAEWYRKAAEKGYRNGQYRLALMLLNGRGVSANRDEAIKWLQLAAPQDMPEAEKLLQKLLSAPPAPKP